MLEIFGPHKKEKKVSEDDVENHFQALDYDEDGDLYHALAIQTYTRCILIVLNMIQPQL